MLMGWGPFRFTVPNYSVEQLSHHVSGRVTSQEVIQARPPTHLLGPSEETITLSSTFHPFHLNGKGLEQLKGVQDAVRKQVPLTLVDARGKDWKRWVGKSVEAESSMFAPGGVPQTVTVSLSLVYYVGGLGGGGFGGGGLSGGINFSGNIGGFSASVSIGF